VRGQDFVFYATFGVVVTTSARIAGVLLVFSYLIVPALAGIALGGSMTRRLLIGWGFGTLVSLIGMVGSAGAGSPHRSDGGLQLRSHTRGVAVSNIPTYQPYQLMWRSVTSPRSRACVPSSQPRKDAAGRMIVACFRVPR